MYTYAVTGVNDYTMIRFDNIAYLVDADLTRVNVTSGQPSFLYDDYELLILTDEGNESVTLEIYDYTLNETHTANTSTPDVIKTPSLTDLTSGGAAYKLNFLEESTGEPDLNYSGYSKLELEGLCDSYSPAVFDLHDYNYSLWLGFKEPMQFRVRFRFNENDTDYSRERLLTTTYENVSFFIPHTLNGDLVLINYHLQDYTGGYANSIQHIQRSITGDNFQDMSSRQWDNIGQINGVWLYKDVYYKVTLTVGDTTNDKGLVIYATNGTQDIRVTTPVYNTTTSPLDGLLHTVWSNVTTGRAYCSYNASALTGFEYANFTVYNASVSPVDELYTSANVTSSIGSFSYLVPDANLTYKVDCVLTINGREYPKSRVFSFNNQSLRFMEPTNVPDPIMGFSLAEVFAAVSLFLLIMVLGFASQYNIHYIMVLDAGLLWLVNHWNWFPENREEFKPILAFLMVFSMLFAFKEARRYVR